MGRLYRPIFRSAEARRGEAQAAAYDGSGILSINFNTLIGHRVQNPVRACSRFLRPSSVRRAPLDLAKSAARSGGWLRDPVAVAGLGAYVLFR